MNYNGIPFGIPKEQRSLCGELTTLNFLSSSRLEGAKVKGAESN
jgi:hypothetical protein